MKTSNQTKRAWIRGGLRILGGVAVLSLAIAASGCGGGSKNTPSPEGGSGVSGPIEESTGGTPEVAPDTNPEFPAGEPIAEATQDSAGPDAEAAPVAEAPSEQIPGEDEDEQEVIDRAPFLALMLAVDARTIEFRFTEPVDLDAIRANDSIEIWTADGGEPVLVIGDADGVFLAPFGDTNIIRLFARAPLFAGQRSYTIVVHGADKPARAVRDLNGNMMERTVERRLDCTADAKGNSQCQFVAN